MDNKLLLSATSGGVILQEPGFYTISDDTGVRYVGSTQNLQQRFNAHNRRLKTGKHENKNLRILSDKTSFFYFNPLPTKTKEEALKIEQEHLNNSQGLCNIATNAYIPAKGRVTTEEQKAKLSKALKGRIISEETRAKMSASRMGLQNGLGHKQTPEHIESRASVLRGRSVSLETREKLAEASKGNTRALGSKHTEEANNRLSIAKGDPVVINGIAYQSAQFTAKQLNISPQTVLNRCASDKFPTWSKIRG